MEADKRAVQIAVALSGFLTPFAGSSFNIALPSIAREYALSAVSMSWASLAYLLSSAMFLIPFGKVADMYGRKRVFLYGIAVFTLASLLLAVYPSSSTIIAFRALQGLGAAMIFGTGVAILVSVHEPHERGRVLGLNVAAVYVGLSVGPALGGFLTTRFGWRSIFLVNVGVGLLVIASTVTKIRGDWAEAGDKRFDLVGSGLYSVMLLVLMYGMSLLPGAEAWTWIAAGLLLFAVFVAVEARADNPVLDVRLFASNRAFTFSNLAALINFSATFAMTLLLSMYLQYLKDMNAQQAGVVMIASPVMQALVSPVAGRLSDRYAPHRLAALGMTITGTSLVPFMFLEADTPLVYVAGSLALLGIGLALFASPNINTIMGSVDKSRYGVASSTQGTMRLTGQMLSTGIAMTLFALNLGGAQVTPELYPQLLTSIKNTFTVFFALCVPGVAASMIRGGVKPGSEAEA